MRLLFGLMAIYVAQGLLLAAALRAQLVTESIGAAAVLNVIAILLLRGAGREAPKPAPIAVLGTPSPASGVQGLVAGKPVHAPLASAPTQLGQPAGGGGLVDDDVIGIETGQHRFIPDYKAQSMPGFAAIYQQIASGEMLGFVMVVAGPDRGKGVPIQQQRITVGRNAGLTLVIHDTSVSAHQCEIWEEGGQVFLGDGGSKNGTWLNNKPVTTKKALANCDVIAFGATKMLVTLGA